MQPLRKTSFSSDRCTSDNINGSATIRIWSRVRQSRTSISASRFFSSSSSFLVTEEEESSVLSAALGIEEDMSRDCRASPVLVVSDLTASLACDSKCIILAYVKI